MARKVDWIVTEIDGKIASVAADYRHFAQLAAKIAQMSPSAVSSVRTHKVATEQLPDLSVGTRWEDLYLIGTKFQISVWRQLFDLSHGEKDPALMSYTDFAALCGNPQGVRPVAHAVAINPVAYIIPCHLIIPKESMDKGREIRDAARETTLFKGSDLYLLDTLDVGEYAYGPVLKRELIKLSLSPKG